MAVFPTTLPHLPATRELISPNLIHHVDENPLSWRIMWPLSQRIGVLPNNSDAQSITKYGFLLWPGAQIVARTVLKAPQKL